jgi:hypothetical protein
MSNHGFRTLWRSGGFSEWILMNVMMPSHALSLSILDARAKAQGPGPNGLILFLSHLRFVFILDAFVNACWKEASTFQIRSTNWLMNDALHRFQQTVDFITDAEWRSIPRLVYDSRSSTIWPHEVKIRAPTKSGICYCNVVHVVVYFTILRLSFVARCAAVATASVRGCHGIALRKVKTRSSSFHGLYGHRPGHLETKESRDRNSRASSSSFWLRSWHIVETVRAIVSHSPDFVSSLYGLYPWRDCTCRIDHRKYSV